MAVAEGTALLRGANPTSNVFEATVERLGSSIKLGLLKPGQQLPPERDLAELIGVSRVTVRSAIEVLAAGGFLITRRGRYGGTFVVEKPPVWKNGGDSGARLERTAVDDLVDRRFVLETGICELAALRITDTMSAGLQDRVARLHGLVSDLEAFRRDDAQLHIAIAEATGNQHLVRNVAEMQAELGYLIGHLPPSVDAMTHSNRQHATIVDCLSRRDGEGARQAMAEHLAGTGHFLTGLLPARGQPDS